MNNFSFETIYYRHNNNTPYTPIEKRTNYFSELTILLHGEMEYYVDGKVYHLYENDAVFINTNTHTERPFYNNQPADYVSFNFIVKEGEEPFATGVIKNCVSAEIKSLITLFDNNNLNKTENYNLKQTNLLYVLLTYIHEKVNTTTENKTVTLIKQYVAKNIGQKITLSSVGKATFFSPVYCDTVFRKETGESIISYVIREKIELAKKLISEGATLQNTAIACGFSDYNYFSRLFKKRTGYSPIKYKNNI